MIKTNIIFKVTSSSIIGSGHIMRVLKICRKLENKNILFITNNFKGNFNYFLSKYDFKILKNSEKNFDSKKDFIDTKNILCNLNGKKILIVDNYFNTLLWQKKIYKLVDKLVVINDYFVNNYCDLFINENFKKKLFKKNIYKMKNCLKLIGPKYYFIEKNRKIKKKKNHIFLFFGGNDIKNIGIKVIKCLSKDKNLFFHLISNDLKVPKLKNDNFKVYKQNDNFYDILGICEFAIVSGGSTLWDVIYHKIPSISILTAKNQVDNLKELEKKKLTNWYKKRIDHEFLMYFYKYFKKKVEIPNHIDSGGLQRVLKELLKLNDKK